MEKKSLDIEGIPGILWGGVSQRGVVAVHGNMSHKADRPIELLAQLGTGKHMQVLSFDLPEHGDRGGGVSCTFQNCIGDLTKVMEYAKSIWKRVSLFAVSMGAYFSLLAFKDEKLKQARFLSPVVDMNRIVSNMMKEFHITQEQLEREKRIVAPTGQALFWEDYCFAQANPIETWNTPTHILYGEQDMLCERESIESFAEKYFCTLEISPKTPHYFHKPEHMETIKHWLVKTWQPAKKQADI